MPYHYHHDCYLLCVFFSSALGSYKPNPHSHLTLLSLYSTDEEESQNA